MATLTGNDGQVVLDGDVCAGVRNFSIDITSDTIETTTMGVDARTYTTGLSSYSGSMDVYFDPVNFNGNVQFNPTTSTVGASTLAGKFYVKQDASNDIVFWANALVVTGFSVTSAMDGMVEGSLSFQGSGAAGFSQTGNV
jgi:hypothetical protein